MWGYKYLLRLVWYWPKSHVRHLDIIYKEILLFIKKNSIRVSTDPFANMWKFKFKINQNKENIDEWAAHKQVWYHCREVLYLWYWCGVASEFHWVGPLGKCIWVTFHHQFIMCVPENLKNKKKEKCVSMGGICRGFDGSKRRFKLIECVCFIKAILFLVSSERSQIKLHGHIRTV